MVPIKRTNLEYFEGTSIKLPSAIRPDPNPINRGINLGDALVELGKYDQATGEYERVIADNPLGPYLLMKKGMVLEKQGKEDEAIQAYDSVLNLNNP